MPKVTNGLLDEAIPINSRGDVNRARVLPQVRAKARPTVSAPSPAPKPAGESEQPAGAFDYVRKRNQLMKGIRGPARTRTRRTARA